MLRWICRYKLRNIRNKYQRLEALERTWAIAEDYDRWIKMPNIIQAFPKGTIVRNEFITAFKNAVHYHDALLRCLDRISARDYIDIDDKVSKTNKYIFDDWVVDNRGYDVDVEQFIRIIFPAIHEVIINIEACRLSRQDLYDYYRNQRRSYLETYIHLVDLGMELYLTGVQR